MGDRIRYIDEKEREKVKQGKKPVTPAKRELPKRTADMKPGDTNRSYETR